MASAVTLEHGFGHARIYPGSRVVVQVDLLHASVSWVLILGLGIPLQAEGDPFNPEPVGDGCT